MEKELKVVSVLNENGNITRQARENLARQVNDLLVDTLGVEIANDKSMLLPLVQDNDGTIIYARLAMSITKETSFKIANKKSKKKVDVVDIPNLFTK